jgi:hypothetical protein
VWCAVLQAYEVVLDVLRNWESADLQDEASVSAVYLLGVSAGCPAMVSPSVQLTD